jgi:hypothetical protein
MTIRGIPWRSAMEMTARRNRPLTGDLHVFLCVCDHFEPAWQRPGRAVEESRVDRWVRDFPRLAGEFADSTGRPPQHTFFYPIEDAEYDDRHVARIAELCRRGFGDVEVHLHHDGETSDQIRELFERRITRLHEEHGLLCRDSSGRITYGFIHGNWALDNSRPDGRWCGLNDEITILRETGCYADFTMPSAPAPCQTTTINSIYYAIDDPSQPKSHDRGIRALVGGEPPGDGLLMIQGPLAWDFGSRKWGLLPRIENGDLTAQRPPSLDRFHRWREACVCVEGRPEWLFVKLHTHGAQEANLEMLLGEPMRQFHRDLKGFAAGNSLKYYYVTAREMAALVHQARSGRTTPCLRSLRNKPCALTDATLLPA